MASVATAAIVLTGVLYLVIMPNDKMNNQERSRFEIRAAVLKALAHPTRLYMVEELADKPLSVGELTDLIKADMSTVSKHLSILKNTGLLIAEKKGKQVYYSLRMRCALNFLSCVENVLKEQAKDRLDAV
jgi:DNA-binding transcriptional ArsR family regulator